MRDEHAEETYGCMEIRHLGRPDKSDPIRTLDGPT